MADEQVPWPQPPREPGPWGGGPPVAPPGNTPLPPLPGQTGVVHNASAQVNPWSATAPAMPPTVPGGPAPFPGMPTQPTRDRAPRWLLAVAALVVLAVVAGGVYAVVSSEDRFPSEWDERVAPIADWVAKERGLSFQHPVEVLFLDEEAYTEASGGGADADVEQSEEEKEEMEQALGQLRALGLISGSPDLDAAGRTVADGGTLAFYSFQEKKVYVRGTELTPAVRVTVAHELVHVLQDQNFDLDRLQELPSNQASTYRALAEGDAGYVDEIYAEKVLTGDERREYEEETARVSDEASEEVFAKIPPILATLFSSPYILGPRLIDYLDAGGKAEINAAFEEPPSQEVLFNPFLFGRPEADPVTVEAEAPEGGEVADDFEPDEFGPVALYLVLASRLDPTEALRAVDGWGGDQYVDYRLDGKECTRIVFAADTPEDLTELSTALVEWVAATPETASTAVDGDRVSLQTCDPGADAGDVGNAVGPDILALPTARVDIFLEVRQGGLDDDQARCYADAIVREIPSADLLSGREASPELQQKLMELGAGCR